MLKPFELARLGRVLQRCKRRELNHSSIRTAHVDVFELVDVQTLRAFDLRDDLVAAALVAKAVDVVAAKQRREVGSDLLQVQTECGHLVAVEDDLRLRLVVLQVGVREHEDTALERFGDELIGEFEQFSGLCGGRNDKLDREVASAGKRRRRDGNDLKTRNRTGLRKQLCGDLFGRYAYVRSTAW